MAKQSRVQKKTVSKHRAVKGRTPRPLDKALENNHAARHEAKKARVAAAEAEEARVAAELGTEHDLEPMPADLEAEERRDEIAAHALSADVERVGA